MLFKSAKCLKQAIITKEEAKEIFKPGRSIPRCPLRELKTCDKRCAMIQIREERAPYHGSPLDLINPTQSTTNLLESLPVRTLYSCGLNTSSNRVEWEWD